MVILERARLLEATLEDLRETYRAVTGGELDGDDLAPARTRVGMALMISADIVGHLGVPRDTTPKPMTIDQLKKMGITMDKTDAVNNELERFNFAPGSLADQLYKTSQAMPKIEPRTPRKDAAAPRSKITSVRATFSGTSKPQAGSLRSAVLKHIQDNTTADRDTVLDEMEQALGYPVRGHVQKLIEKNHLTVTSTSVPEPTEAAPAPEHPKEIDPTDPRDGAAE